jgi:glycosyltransferase involved in cell wall biosynthesis
MSSINLISPSKGFEYAIEAIPKIVKQVPNFLYLIIGETHPVYLKENGGVDVYRNYLKKRVRELGIKKHVRFIKEYVSIKKLVKYIGASDYYITPYLEPQQAASGALAYAIGAGTVCISTPFLYAEEMLGKYRGVLVPFRNSEEIAESIIRIEKNPKERDLYENSAYEVGRTMTWYKVAHQYLHLFKYAVNGNH